MRKANLAFSISLFFTLGISWVFGFLSFGTKEASMIFAYIFAIFTSLQGKKLSRFYNKPHMKLFKFIFIF